MKKLIVGYGILVLILISCHTEDDTPVTTIKLTIETNKELQYPLGNRPTEGGYSISKQPQAYKTSEIISTESEGLAYVYIPEQGFKGLDVVEITLRTSLGNNDFTKNLIILRITVE